MCGPTVSGFSRVTHPAATNCPLSGSLLNRLLEGSLMGWRDDSTFKSETGWPSTVTDSTSAVPARAQLARSVPAACSKVLHSLDAPTTKIRVPDVTVHEGTLSGPKGATTLPPRFQQVLPLVPGLKGF